MKDKFDEIAYPLSFEKQSRFYELLYQYETNNSIKSWHEYDDPSYKEIIAFGKDIIPLLLHNLGNGWVPMMALHELAGKVFEVDRETEAGRYNVIAQKWYDWGVEQGYI